MTGKIIYSIEELYRSVVPKLVGHIPPSWEEFVRGSLRDKGGGGRQGCDAIPRIMPLPGTRVVFNSPLPVLTSGRVWGVLQTLLQVSPILEILKLPIRNTRHGDSYTKVPSK